MTTVPGLHQELMLLIHNNLQQIASCVIKYASQEKVLVERDSVMMVPGIVLCVYQLLRQKMQSMIRNMPHDCHHHHCTDSWLSPQASLWGWRNGSKFIRHLSFTSVVMGCSLAAAHACLAISCDSNSLSCRKINILQVPKGNLK